MSVLKQQEMIRLCHSGLDARRLRIELLQRLQRAIPFNYVYFSTTDPATGFGTSSVLTEPPPAWLMSIFIENEFLQDDFNQFSTMVRERQTVGILREATGYDLQRSPRYRDMLLPLGMGDELRAIFATDGACWGTLCLHREGVGYTPAEAACVAELAPHIADGLRKAVLLDVAFSETAPDGPGVLLLTDDLSITAMTAAAEYWLSELAETETMDKHVLPLTIRAVVAGLKALEAGKAGSSMPKIRVHTRSGHWLVVYASRLKSAENPAQITVILESAQATEVAPLMMQAYQLTKREGDITQCVLRGWSTSEIAAKLFISPNTVQDHLKAIFEKVDVSSRGELAARIFTRQYQPHYRAIEAGDGM